jgi:hypothetical protein
MAILAYGMDTVDKGQWIGFTGSKARVFPAQPTWNGSTSGWSISLSGVYRVGSSGAGSYGLQNPSNPSVTMSNGAQADTTGATDVVYACTAPAGTLAMASVYCYDVTYNESSRIQVRDDADNVLADYLKNRYLANAFWVRVLFTGTAKLVAPAVLGVGGRNKSNCCFLDQVDHRSGLCKTFFHHIV